MTTLSGTYRLNSKTAVTTQYKFVSQTVTNVTSYVSLRHMSTIKDSNQRHVNRCLNIAYGTLMSIYIVFTRRPMYTWLFYLNPYKKKYKAHYRNYRRKRKRAKKYNKCLSNRLKLNEKNKQLVNTLYQLNYMYHDFNIGI